MVIYMLFYCSLHPDWDYSDPSQRRNFEISELLGTVAMTHSRNTGACFDALERHGVILGSGGVLTILLQKDPEEQIDPLDPVWFQTVVDAVRSYLSVPLWYGLSMGGKTYILVCFPRLQEGDAGVSRAIRETADAAGRIGSAMAAQCPRLRIIVSDMQFGEAGIFRTFNDLTHALDYYDFRTEQSSPILLNSEQQLHGALISDLSAYRKLSVQIGEQLSRSDFSPEAAANQICRELMRSSVPSMESVHYQVQFFILTFTDYLGSSGLVDAAYLQRNRIVYRVMAFERETELRDNIASILDELHRQNRTLQSIGKQKRIQSIRDYVQDHISDPLLTVGQITEQFQVSGAQLAKQFRYYYGLSLHRYIQQARFHRAETLLREHPDWSTRKIAEAAGYSDLATMYRAFHTFGDITPGALRDSLRQIEQA